MRLVFTLIFIFTCLAISGTCFGTSSLPVMLIFVNQQSGAAVIKTVNVKMGENITFHDTTPGMGNVRRVSVQKCENGTGDIFRYCSPEEEIFGCSNINSGRFSIQINNASISVTLLEAKASDEDCYVFSVTDERNKVNKTKVNVKVYGVPLVPPDTPRTDGLFTISLNHLCILTGGIAFVIAFVIIVVYVVIFVKCMCQKKKKNNSDDRTEDPKEVIPSSHINGAGKPDTDESLEIVDETSQWMDNENLRSKDLNHGA